MLAGGYGEVEAVAGRGEKEEGNSERREVRAGARKGLSLNARND